MRRATVWAFAIAVGCAAAASAQTTRPAGEADLQRELTELRERVKALEERTKNLDPRRVQRGPDEEALANIKLPPNATREQVASYVTEIARASGLQTSFSRHDPQVAMLAQVGPQHVDLLIERLNREGNPYTGYHLSASQLVMAVEELVEERHKSLVIEALPRHHALVSIVLNHGWAEDARDVLIEQLRRGPRTLPVEWVAASASVDDAEMTEALQEYFVRTDEPGWAYEVLQNVPGLDLSDAVAAVWARVRPRPADDPQRQDVAPIAAEHGHLDALEALIDSLDENENQGLFHPRQTVQRFIAVSGTDEQIQQWFRENKSKLKFDPLSKMFLTEDFGGEAATP